MVNKLILIYFLNFISICILECPPKKIIGKCWCVEDPDAKVSCRSIHYPSTLRNVTIYSISLTNVKSKLIEEINVKAGELEIRGRSTSIEHLEPFTAMEPFRIIMFNTNEELVYRFFEHKSDKVLQFFIYGNFFNKLDLKFINYPNVRNIFMVNLPAAPTKINELPSLVFHGLENLDQINLNSAGIRFLGENSLKLSTRSEVIIDMYNNHITAEQFNKANFSNTAEISIDLTANGIEKFPAHVFEKFIELRPSHEINLKANPIICKCDEVKWIFKYEFRMSPSFPLKNVECQNKNYQNLLQMSEKNFDDCTKDGLTLTPTSTILETSSENYLEKLSSGNVPKTFIENASSSSQTSTIASASGSSMTFFYLSTDSSNIEPEYRTSTKKTIHVQSKPNQHGCPLKLWHYFLIIFLILLLFPLLLFIVYLIIKKRRQNLFNKHDNFPVQLKRESIPAFSHVYYNKSIQCRPLPSLPSFNMVVNN